jgi:O-antigen/teichoic acid export membrane protein
LLPLGPRNFAEKAKSLAAKGMQSRGAKRGVWALVDQGIVSLGNFATTALMIRYLAKDDFARFGLFFEVILYLNSFQAALVTYPLTVRGTNADPLRLRKLATGCLGFTLALAPALAALMTLASWLLSKVHSADVADAVAAAPAATVFHAAPYAIAAMLLWQAQEVMRRALLSQFRYQAVLPGDAVSYLGQAVAFFILAKQHSLTLSHALLSMAITSALAAALQAMQIGLSKMSFSDMKQTAIDFWSFGRWSLSTSVAAIFTDFSFSWLLAGAGGLEASAAFQVMGNLTKPCNIVINAIPNVATPAAARARAQTGVKAGWVTTVKYFALGAVVLSPYVLALLIWPQGIMKLLYRTNAQSYVQYANVARFNILALIGGYIANGLGVYLSAMEETRYNFISAAINTCAVFLIGLPLTYFGHLWGAIIGCTLCVSVRLIANAVFVRRVHDGPNKPPTNGEPIVLPGPAAEDNLATAEAIAVI